MNVRCRACAHDFEVPSGAVSAVCPRCQARLDLTSLETRARPTQLAGVDAPAALIGAIAGAHRIEAVLGQGGMGVVYEAQRVGEGITPERVAIKVLAAELSASPELVARFQREAEALTRLEHPNLIKVYGHGVFTDPAGRPRYFFVMERFDGEDLRARLARGSLSPRAVAAILRGAAEGLVFAHQQGIVHRDVKPANILVRGDPAAGGAVKVVDFGVAHIAAGEYTLTSLTHSALILGTINYMAPEQRLDAATIDPRADTYALAVVAYELFTGRLPLGAFAPPSRLAALPRALDRAILGALQPDPAARPARTTELVEQIERALVPRLRARTAAAGGALAAAAAVVGWLVIGGSEPAPSPADVGKVAQEAPPVAPPPARPTPAGDPATTKLARAMVNATSVALDRVTRPEPEPPPDVKQVNSQKKNLKKNLKKKAPSTPIAEPVAKPIAKPIAKPGGSKKLNVLKEEASAKDEASMQAVPTAD